MDEKGFRLSVIFVRFTQQIAAERCFDTLLLLRCVHFDIQQLRNLFVHAIAKRKVANSPSASTVDYPKCDAIDMPIANSDEYAKYNRAKW